MDLSSGEKPYKEYLKEEYLGILEAELYIVSINKESKENKEYKLNLHYLFSFIEGYLVCKCLDFNIHTHINLTSKIKEIEYSDNKEFLINFVKRIIGDISETLTLDIINHLLLLKDENIEKLMWHSDEYYWKEYRLIKREKDNYHVGEILYSNKKYKNFINLNDAILGKLKNLKLENLEPESDSTINVSCQNTDIFFNKEPDELIQSFISDGQIN